MNKDQFINILKTNSEAIAFADTMSVIEANYTFTPRAFTNGNVENKAGENSGSCKLFAFASKENLTKEETLLCFAEHYRDVLKDTKGTSHQNIRNFMNSGFDGLSFNGEALESK